MKIRKSIDSMVIALLDNGAMTLLPPDEFNHKVRKVASSYNAKHLLIQTGTNVSSYAFIDVDSLPKRFEPFKIKYKMAVISNNIGKYMTADFVCNTNVEYAKGGWVEFDCRSFPMLIAFLYSISRIYAISTMMSSRYDTVNDYELSNRMLVLGPIEITKNNMKIISPDKIHNNLGSIITYLSGALDYNSDQLLGWTTPPKSLFISAKRLVVDTRRNKWEISKIKRLEDAPSKYPEDCMISALGMFRNDLIFVTVSEVEFLNQCKVTGGESQLVVYMNNHDTTFEESLDHPINCIDILAHPELFYVQHTSIRTLISMDDLLIEISSVKYQLILERTVMDIIGIDKDCEIILDINIIMDRAESMLYTSYGYEAYESSPDPIMEVVNQLIELV